MTEIKSNYKMCPRCGKKINWRKLNKRRQRTFEEAKKKAIYLNDQRAMDGIMSVKEILQSLKEDKTE